MPASTDARRNSRHRYAAHARKDIRTPQAKMCAVLCSISTGGGQSRTFRGRTLTYTAACSRTDNGVCNSLLVTVKERVITPLRLARAAEAFGLRWKLPAFWLSSETKRVTTSVPAHARRWLLALCAIHGQSRRFIDPWVDGQLILVEIVSLSAWPDTDPTPALALASFVRAPHTGLQQLDVLLIAFRKSNQSLRSLSSTAAHPYGSFRAGTPFPASAVPAIAANLSECWQPYSWTTSSTWFHRRVLSHLAARLLACRQRAGTIHDMSSRATSHPSGWLSRTPRWSEPPDAHTEESDTLLQVVGLCPSAGDGGTNCGFYTQTNVAPSLDAAIRRHGLQTFGLSPFPWGYYSTHVNLGDGHSLCGNSFSQAEPARRPSSAAHLSWSPCAGQRRGLAFPRGSRRADGSA